ncbi:MAG TPA: acetamidase/formamidase family protein [Pilimelia sp.]|nr:acetamidase/formamidase family protein [Pilimelia sp.]
MEPVGRGEHETVADIDGVAVGGTPVEVEADEAGRQQAYAICSVAVDLKVSQLVDVPSFLVSAFLPEDIFTT